MEKWKVFYSNCLENTHKGFTVKASNKGDAIERAINYVNKHFYICDRLLNHYTITLVNN